jgi:hypothetical protein
MNLGLWFEHLQTNRNAPLLSQPDKILNNNGHHDILVIAAQLGLLGLLHVGDDHAGLRLVDRTPFQVRLFEHRALQVRDEQLVLGVLKEEVELGIRNILVKDDDHFVLSSVVLVEELRADILNRVESDLPADNYVWDKRVVFVVVSRIMTLRVD